jgi:putative Mn2+ efflux pump MntP
MIVDALKDEKEADQVCNSTNIFTVRNLTIQGIATSIDALAVGVSLVAVDVNIASISLIIGIITFLCCALGVYIGRRFGLLLGIRAKLAGGILLVLIGIKIFVQHIVS